MRLQNLPEEEKKAYLLGDWNVFKGQYFKAWRSDVHVIEPFAIPWNWEKCICLDYGYTNPSAVYWLAKNEDGAIFVYREIYVTKFLYDELVAEIVRLNKEDIRTLIADPALQTKSPDSNISFFDVASRAGFDIIPGINDRVPGWNLFKSLLEIYEDEKKGLTTMIYFFSTCVNAIRTIPTLIHDERNVEDLNSDGEDHSADSIRYGLNWIAQKIDSLLALASSNSKKLESRQKKVVLLKKRF